jgi:hypothetical protein
MGTSPVDRGSCHRARDALLSQCGCGFAAPDGPRAALPTGRLDNPSGVAHKLHSHDDNNKELFSHDDNNKELFFFQGKITRPAEELNMSMLRFPAPSRPIKLSALLFDSPLI